MRDPDRQPARTARRARLACSGLVVAAAVVLAVGPPATASVRIVNAPVSAQAGLVNDSSLWAEVAGQVTFSTGMPDDTMVALTAPPKASCPRRPPPGVPTYPGPGADAESSSLLLDGQTGLFSLTPRRRQVNDETVTRVCVYLVRAGVVRARGSRRLTVSLSPFAPAPSHRAHATKNKHTGRSVSVAKTLLGAVLLVLALIGLAAIGRKLSPSPAGDQRVQPPTPAGNQQPTGASGARPSPVAEPAAAARPNQERPPPTRRVPASAAGNGRPAKAASNGRSPASATRPPSESDVTGLLRQVTFSPHALERFAKRAGLPPTSNADVDVIVRDLLTREGRAASEAPEWARSNNPADLYLVAGEWMTFLLRTDRYLPWCWYCVTVVNGPHDNTWENALRRGYIHTRPPGQA